MNETSLINVIKLEASRKSARLWRNNVGATYTPEGSFIRYGLANESKAINKILKSSDLIGIKTVVITPDMVGKTIGQFLAREVKPTGWKFSGTEREVAQQNFINLINSLSGNAAFATEEGTL